MFTPIDLIFPWGICVIAVGLCLWAAIKGKAKDRTAMRIATLGTAAVFVLAIPGWYIARGILNNPDYVSSYGIEVVQGKINKCKQRDIDSWSEWVVNFWSSHYDTKKVQQSLKGKKLVCLDMEKIPTLTRYVRGVSHGRMSAIGWNGEIEYTRSLFIHEMSHHIVDQFIPYDEQGHHNFFKEKNLGH